MNQERLLKVLLAPHVSEKSSYAATSGRQYVFRVADFANKYDIRAAVQKLFDVKVTSVRVTHVKGKKARVGKILGQRSGWKKAYVTVAQGSEIEIGA